MFLFSSKVMLIPLSTNSKIITFWERLQRRGVCVCVCVCVCVTDVCV